MSESLLKAPAGLSYAEALAGFANGKLGANVSAKGMNVCAKLLEIDENHPRASKILKHMILNRYEAATDVDAGTVDWTSILQWLVENLPKLFEIFLAFFALL
jgi:hypothetical protein